MKSSNKQVDFVIEFFKTYAVLSRRLDAGLGGISFNEFLILQSLDSAKDKKMKRVDLAQKIGMTASGVTRLLLPMEKVRMVKSGKPEKDARARYVALSAGGKLKLKEAQKRMQEFCEEFFCTTKNKDLENFNKFLSEIRLKVML